MRSRSTRSVAGWGLPLMLALASVAAAGGQSGTDDEWKAPRTAWGDPDLQGGVDLRHPDPARAAGRSGGA